MSKRVRCISPHGGCHNGMRHDGNPVFALPDGSVPEVAPEKLRLPPNPGGWINNVDLGYCAVGQEYDAPDDFEPDGFHFEDAGPPPPPPPAPTSTAEAGEGK